MNSNLRRSKALLIFTFAVCVLGLFGASITLICALVKPEVGLSWLYAVWRSVRLIMFILAGFYVAAGFAMDWIYSQSPEIRRIFKPSVRDKWIVQIVGAICLILLLFSWKALYVQPAGGKWFAVSKAGTWEISETTARQYLWRNLVWHCVVIIAPGLGLAFLSGSLFRANISVQDSATALRR